MVVLSQGELSQLHRALRVLSAVAQESSVQVIVVRAGWAPNDLSGAGVHRLVRVGADARRAEMTDAGMPHASGDIVILRHDHAITDVVWLARLLPQQTQSAILAERPVPQIVHRHADHVSGVGPAARTPGNSESEALAAGTTATTAAGIHSRSSPAARRD